MVMSGKDEAKCLIKMFPDREWNVGRLSLGFIIWQSLSLW